MAITGAVTVAPEASKTVKAAGATYNAYTAFQVEGPWASRSNWADGKTGLNGGKDYTVKDVGKLKSGTYNYTKQFLVYNADAKDNIIDGQIKDAVIDKNGTYTMEIGNCPIAGLPAVDSGQWSMLSICTDIPVTEKNVKCTDVKVYFDDSATPFAELANAPYNKEATNNGVLDFFIFDKYSETHETKGVLDATAAKYKVYPKKSMKIEFTISGINFEKDKEEVVVDNGLMEGQSFTAGDYKYKVMTRSKSDGTKGTVAITGLSAAAAKKTSLTTPTVAANNDGCKYTVTNIAKQAFANNKTLKSVKLGSTTKSIGVGAFKKCTKLTGFTFNKKVSSVNTSAFEGCKKTITVSGKKANKTYTVDQIKKSGYKKVK